MNKALQVVVGLAVVMVFIAVVMVLAVLFLTNVLGVDFRTATFVGTIFTVSLATMLFFRPRRR